MKNTFSDDLAFLKKHTKVIVLSDASGHGKVAVAPDLQGRVMTSTGGGDDGLSFGWINRELLRSGKSQEHINAYGGEDRFWIGPEGGQFSVFFKKGVEQEFENWFTPAAVDSEPFDVVSETRKTVVHRRAIRLTNYSDTVFDLVVDRDVRIIELYEAAEKLGVEVPDNVKVVAFESANKITNAGEKAWTKDTGLLSIWILGMLNPSQATTVVVPYNVGPQEKLGSVVNDTYFGKVPSARLVVKEGVMYFSGDGKYRSKIGLTPQRAKSVLGSYDADNGVLTLAQYSKQAGETDYVNSMWEKEQTDPFTGDIINSYNDGPMDGAKQLGPFYELETSSAAAALKPDETVAHIHRTFHLQGDESALDPIAKVTLGVGIADIKPALSK